MEKRERDQEHTVTKSTPRDCHSEWDGHVSKVSQTEKDKYISFICEILKKKMVQRDLFTKKRNRLTDIENKLRDKRG